MRGPHDYRPYMAVIGNDDASTSILAAMLAEAGGPLIECIGDHHLGAVRLQEIVREAPANWPDAVVFDLPTYSGTALQLVGQLTRIVEQTGIAVIVFTQAVDREARQAFYEAGASAVFFRQGDPQACRREIQGIISFWARLKRLDAVGM